MKISSCTLVIALFLWAVSSTFGQDADTVTPSPLTVCSNPPIVSTPNSQIYRFTLPCSITVTELNAAELVGEDIATTWGCYFPKPCVDQGKVCSGPIGTGSASSAVIVGPIPLPGGQSCGWQVHFTGLATTVECPCIDPDDEED